MGYQRVEATLRDNKTRRGIAFNAELLILDDETQAALRMDAGIVDPYAAILKKSAENSGTKIKALRVLNSVAGTGHTAAVRALQGKAGPAKDAPTEKTKAGQVFKRFSAYRNDRRVTPGGGMLPGSYATTEEDAKHVKTGQDAVERYALPNPEPASYPFKIEPHKDTDIKYGVAEPANGQPGGGVEVIYTKGTQEKTVTPLAKIPDRDADKTQPAVDELASQTSGVRYGVSER
jgi:hypothetical protein